MLYCIHCEIMDKLIDELELPAHFRENENPDGLVSWEFCLGPFAASEPPTLEEDWHEHMPELTSYEYNVVSSFAASRLLADALGSDLSETYI